jgi:Zn-dependent peptidase ImmA (M78 family)
MIMDYKSECEQFIAWCKPKLGIQTAIRVTLVHAVIKKGAQSTFGYFEPHTGRIVISCADRHVMDVIRTLCHEMVHVAQHAQRPLQASDGATGSPIENEANALAGILLRLYGQDCRGS